MDAPSVQYVKTSDGYSIAYCVKGDGIPFVMMPCILQSDITWFWDKPLYRSFFQILAERFKLVQYDGRGTGNSARSLPEDVKLEDCALDVEAVTDKLDFDKLILYADVFTIYPALDFAVRHPDKIIALVFVNPTLQDGEPLMAVWRSLYQDAWVAFINSFAATFMQPGVDDTAAYLHGCIDQADFNRLASGATGRCIADLLPRVKSPTLILANRSPASPRVSLATKQIAEAIPNSRLLYFEGSRNGDFLYSTDGSTPQAIVAIDEFLADLLPRAAPLSEDSGAGKLLSHRELEVLRLLAAGKSNQQIANELVISLNTARKHVANILDKTGTANRTEAAGYARDHGLT